MKRMRSLGLCLALSGLSLSVGAVDGVGVSSDVSSSAVTQVKKYKKRSKAAIWKEHHFEVSYSKGKIVRVRYLRNKDSRVLIESHLGGMHPEEKVDKTVNLSVQKFRKEIKKYINKHERRVKLNPKKASSQSVAGGNVISMASQSDDGIGLGADASVGYLGPQSQCYQFSTLLSSPVTNISMSEVQGADSYAQAWNASASISGKTRLFRAKATATYGSNYEESSYSGNMIFSGSLVYDAHNTFIGLGQYIAGECGSQFVADIPVGMLVTGQFTWSSSSESASNSITASVSGSGSTGLAKMSTAVSAAYASSNSNSHTSFNFGYQLLGGDAKATGDIASGFVSEQDDLENCLNYGNMADCNNFALQWGGDVSTALSEYQGYLETAPFYTTQATATSPSVPSALASLGIFPDGIAGIDLPYIFAAVPLSDLMSSGSYPDALHGYKNAITNYLDIMNQISSLYNRTQYLINALSIGTYNPIPMWDLKSQINYVANTYYGDLNSMQQSLDKCMGTLNNAEKDCEALTNVYNAGITNAYEWYAPTGPNPNGATSDDQSMAQQNAIALQYTAVAMDNVETVANDVFFVNQLPSAWYAKAYPGTWLPSQYPALVAFTDQPWGNNNVKPTITAAAVQVYSPGQGGNMLTPISSWLPNQWSFFNSSWSSMNGWQTTLSLNGENVNSFTQPAGMVMNTPAGPFNVTFSPIPNFFSN